MTYSLAERLAFSRGARERTDIETLKALIDGCVSVEKTDEQTDRRGVDYIATLRKGATLLIDAKARDKGCSRFWTVGPEVALEDWSVVAGGKYGTPDERKRVGWTLCEGKETDLILFTFDPDDSDEVFLVSYQLLRMAFRRNIHDWRKRFKTAYQDSGAWESHCIFVPIDAVFDAMYAVSRPYMPPRQQLDLRLLEDPALYRAVLPDMDDLIVKIQQIADEYPATECVDDIIRIRVH